MHVRHLSVMIVTIACALTQFSFDASARVVRMERISMAPYGNFNRWLSANISPPPNELMPLREAPADAMALPAPSYLPKAIIQIPIPDQDGNATGGVRLPDMAAPLGTHGGQTPPLSFTCSLGSSYLAFAKTKEEREAVSDSRPSLLLSFGRKHGSHQQ
jgi:hypothetical protein